MAQLNFLIGKKRQLETIKAWVTDHFLTAQFSEKNPIGRTFTGTWLRWIFEWCEQLGTIGRCAVFGVSTLSTQGLTLSVIKSWVTGHFPPNSVKNSDWKDCYGNLTQLNFLIGEKSWRPSRPGLLATFRPILWKIPIGRSFTGTWLSWIFWLMQTAKQSGTMVNDDFQTKIHDHLREPFNKRPGSSLATFP